MYDYSYDETDIELADTEETVDAVDAELSAADAAAEYVRSFEGFEKAADYVGRHFEGEEYIPGDVITVSTRNQALEGNEELEGVSFERREVELTDGLVIGGVFPRFDSKHHVELGAEANDMTLHQQFTACKEDFQDHMFDDREKLKDITLGDMERMDKPQGYAPEGWTWNHDLELGTYDLVRSDIHSIAHTGGNAFWGIS